MDEFLQNLMFWKMVGWSQMIPLVAAIVMGGLIGLEREFHLKSAGLRTNILICLGAAMLTRIAVQIDPTLQTSTRIIQGIITGVGFIGAGVLIHQGTSIHGLTTAATIWLVTAIGIACGTEKYQIAILSTIVTLVILIGLNPLDQKIDKRAEQKNHIEHSKDDSNQ